MTPERFEEQLRESLRRVEAPAGFEQRILARVESRRRSSQRRWLAVAASVVMMVSAGGYGMHWREEQVREARVEQARAQLEFALKLTSRQLAKAEGQLRTIGIQQIDLREVAQ